MIQTVLFITLLTIASVIDISKRIIPDTICVILALMGLIHFSPVKFYGILTALPLLIPALCKRDSIGGGDIKLSAACGLVLGLKDGITGLIVGLAAMIIFFAASKAVAWMQKDKNREKRVMIALPMAPFLSIGFMAIYITGI